MKGRTISHGRCVRACEVKHALFPSPLFYLMKFHSFSKITVLVLGLGTLFVSSTNAEPPAIPALPRLTVHGENFVAPSGTPVRFWGVNVVALYPDHATADAFAAHLASLQVNLVRPHHILRSSLDWNPTMVSGSLVAYHDTSREFDADALDRFDYLNAAYRRNGIYVAFSAHWSRTFRPGDADILTTTPDDQAAWAAGMKELNGWDWKKSGDDYKNLPVIDERCALLIEEFNKKLLAHVNPYTATSYATDSQILTYEIINESSLEYAIICQNRFPDYFQKELTDKWNDFATKAGVVPGDLYKPADTKVAAVRAQFLRKMDEAYFARMKSVLRGAGCQASITYSNLWRGDNASQMEFLGADHVEGHQYMDPLVVGGMSDGLIDLTKTALVGKPYIIGELNEAEGEKNITSQASSRTMLPLVASAYGSLQNWSGVIWFAWTHGAKTLAPTGQSVQESRAASEGVMMDDSMMIDHLRTTGIIFRRQLVAPSKDPGTLWIDDPLTATNYSGLIHGKYNYAPGWQGVHEIRTSYGPVPADQATAPWMTQPPPNPVVSDTGEIVKDTSRRQLTVAAPQAEAFSGFLDGKPLQGPKHLLLDGDSGFATVIMVADDNTGLGDSSHLILSRTGLDTNNADSASPAVKLAGLKAAPEGTHWYLTVTRPPADPKTAVDPTPLTPGADGTLDLPHVDWHECELELHK